MLIQKTTKSERLKNTAALDQLMFSFFDANILGFKRVLADDGIFLGKSKMEFLSRLNTKFNSLKEKGVHGVGIHTGICVDRMPGCEVFEVRYALSHDLLDKNGMYFSKANSAARENETVLRFSFRLKGGKIVEINRTRLYHLATPKKCDSEINYN